MSKRTWWWALIGLGLVTRFLLLPTAPLNVRELHQMLPALDMAQGQAVGGTADPLLTLFNALAFLLLGAGEGTARLLPALGGVALLAVPWLWRRRIGEMGALTATALLVLSPLALGVARRATGEGMALLGAALLWTVALVGVEGRARWWLLFAGWLLGLGGGPTFYDVLLGGLFAWALTRWAYPDEPDALRVRLDAMWLEGLLTAVLVLGVSGWVAGIGFAAPFDGLAAWLETWTVPRSEYSLLWPFLYEPLTLLLALVALGRAFKVPSPWAVFTWLWAFGALLLAVLRPGAASIAVVGCMMPLTLLAGQAAEHINQSWRGWQAGGEGAHAVLALVLWFHAGQALGRHTTAVANGTELAIVALVAAMQVLLVVGFRMIFIEPARAWRGLLLGTVGVLLLLQSSSALAVGFWRADNPNEPLTGAVMVRAEVEHLRETLAARAVHLQDAAVTRVGADSGDALAAARWALRDVTTLRALTWEAVTTPFALTAGEVASPTGWMGRPFTLVLRPAGRVPGCTQTWPPLCQHPLAWYLYRRNPLPPVREAIALWVR